MASSSSSKHSPPGELNDGEDDDPYHAFPELLDFASRVQVLISELLLLSGRIPPEFSDRRFDAVLFDLRYFNCPDDFEARISGNRDLEALEDELRDSCHSFLQRFYILAIGVVTYHQDIVKYLNDIQDGVYLENTLDKILESSWGRHVLTESLSLFGCLLLLLEHCMGGFLREKLLVAHVRYVHSFDEPMLDSLCSLCRVHSPMQAQAHLDPWRLAMITVQKPENLFVRFPLPKVVLDGVIRHMRDDDLYNRIRYYPDPQHRSVALSSQAGCLYVLLLYSPELLHDGFVMREIVDRFFKDCWVVPIFLYFAVDLSVSWDAYKEAKAALSSYHSPTFVRDRSQLHCAKVKDLMSQIDLVLSNGTITRDYIFENSQNLLALIRTCNISMRWLLLHRSSVDKKLKEVVVSVGSSLQVDDESLLLLLLKISQIEFEVKQLYEKLLEDKGALWNENKCLAIGCIKEVSQHLSDSWVSSHKIKNESLKDLFAKLTMELVTFDYTRAGFGRKLYHAVSALRDVEKIDEVVENPGIKQRISEIITCLQTMAKAINIDDDTLPIFAVITDAVYAWEFVVRSTTVLNKKIGQNSLIVRNLHSFFLKFRSLLELPVLWISRNNSCDLSVASNYYLSIYVDAVYAVLEIIPVMLFKIFGEDNIQSLQPFQLPNRIENVQLQDFMQLDVQLTLATAINNVSNYSQGLLAMSRNFKGLLDLDMKRWLEARIKMELERELQNKLNSCFLPLYGGLEVLEESLRSLTTYFHLQLHMMRCFQDLLHVHGIDLWEEVLANILKCCAEKEQNGIMKRKQGLTTTDMQLNDFFKAQTFLGRLLHQMLHLTDPRHSMFIESMSGWFDAEGNELLGLHFFVLLESCIGAVGMLALDSLLTLLVMEILEYVWRGLEYLMNSKCMEELSKMNIALGHTVTLPLVGYLTYNQMGKIVDASWNYWIECLAYVGQLQLLRSMVSLDLKMSSQVKTDPVSFSVESMAVSVSSESEIMLKCVNYERAKKDKVELFLQELKKHKIFCGLFSPLQTIYISKDPPVFLGLCTVAVSISQLQRYVYDSHLGTLTTRLKTVTLDFSPLIIGLGTFLKQFHPSAMTQYVQYMGQYVRATAETVFGGAGHEPQKGFVDPTSEVSKSVFWLMCFSKIMEIPEDLIGSVIPPSLFAVLQN